MKRKPFLNPRHIIYSPSNRSHRLLFLRTTHSLTSICGPHHDTILPSRLARAVLPSLTSILASRSSLQEESVGAAKNRKGKKRARGYEGDEVFQMTKSMMCTSEEDGDVLLAALDGEHSLVIWAFVSDPVHSNPDPSEVGTSVPPCPFFGDSRGAVTTAHAAANASISAFRRRSFARESS